jgi:hypothetical protein
VNAQARIVANIRGDDECVCPQSDQRRFSMNMKALVATAALLGSALALSLPVIAADSAGGAAPTGQAKPAVQPAPPAAKPADKAATTVPADCAKLTDPKAKDD